MNTRNKKVTEKPFKVDLNQVLWSVYQAVFHRHQYNVVQHVRQNTKGARKSNRLRSEQGRQKPVGYTCPYSLVRALSHLLVQPKLFVRN